jgi:hypothetical protein
MSKAKDVEIRPRGIDPRQYRVTHGPTGRRKYPFKKMICGDFIELWKKEDVLAIRNSLKTFHRRHKNVHFTVRQKANDTGLWICRRML